MQCSDGCRRTSNGQISVLRPVSTSSIRIFARVSSGWRKRCVVRALAVKIWQIHVVGQLAIEVARFCEAVTDGPAVGGLASWRLRLIDERLHRYGSSPLLDELAELCGLSVRQLTRGFSASRGCTVGSYIASMRIEQAKRRLDTNESIKEIAGLLPGFPSPSAFSYAFRRATGSTPRQFRPGNCDQGRYPPLGYRLAGNLHGRELPLRGPSRSMHSRNYLAVLRRRAEQANGGWLKVIRH